MTAMWEGGVSHVYLLILRFLYSGAAYREHDGGGADGHDEEEGV